MGMTVEEYIALGLDVMFDEAREDIAVNGRRISDISASALAAADRVYNPCSHATRRPGTPAGEVTQIGDYRSTTFEGTSRVVSVYTPPGLDAASSPPLLVFNDGSGYLHEAGPVRAAAVLDSLIAAGDLEPTMAVFVDPGRPVDAPVPESRDRSDPGFTAMMQQRAVEYDSVNPRYGSFLVDEVLPHVAEVTGVDPTDDPSRRGIVGISSGGIAAFVAAWHHPESFGLVVSHCGSFVNIRGGHVLPYLIRTTPRKPLRVFLQSGENDADVPTGNWPLANRQMAAALEYAGYEHRFEFGVGGHSLRHGGAIFADTLRWLFA